MGFYLEVAVSNGIRFFSLIFILGVYRTTESKIENLMKYDTSNGYYQMF